MISVRAELKMVPTFLKVGVAEMTAYRVEVVIWILTTTLPLIMFAMWSTVARQAPVGRFDEAMFASYFLSTLIVRQMSGAWIVWVMNHEIRTGALSMALLKPVHPLLYHAAANIGAWPIRIAVLVPITALAYWGIDGIAFSSDPLHIALFCTCVFGAWALSFVVQALIGLLALYTEQSLSFQDAWFGLWAILSGYLIPLELMPSVEPIARWLPFRSMGSLPTEIILGHVERADLAMDVAIQGGWLLALVTLLAVAWPRAMRRFEAYGN